MEVVKLGQKTKDFVPDFHTYAWYDGVTGQSSMNDSTKWREALCRGSRNRTETGSIQVVRAFYAVHEDKTYVRVLTADHGYALSQELFEKFKLAMKMPNCVFTNEEEVEIL